MKLFIFLSIAFILGWNVFLIQRDAKLFEAYNQPSLSERVK